ncbi:glycosyltransferase family 9 protein [Parabacteroides sp. FAFU027]|uniref:glycosyltransferase family 9 protein n=1 Tax=Parabacteroides sp. FAFU027 TaxID=2922715 RepID=UPI001FAFA3C0|nr:glycosyltransferase family 9 protein [Parabacteroides sp. FAFU027]
MKKILIIRFSALGDVAMTIPITYSYARQNPDVEIVFLSKPSLTKLFFNAPKNFRLITIDAQGRHKGFFGLFRLFLELKKEKFDAVIDLHSVLRSHFLSRLFRLIGVKTATVHKGRAEKERLTHKHDKHFHQLATSFDRYLKTFHDAGIDFKPDFESIFEDGKGDLTLLADFLPEKRGKWIGIAPFAKHKGKIYPLEKMEEVVGKLSKESVKIFLFGGGESEKVILEKWAATYPNTICTIGKINMEKELHLMSHLDGMITMDSGNMHMASLVNCPVISIWGATHPYAGFYGWQQAKENAVQLDLSCRPCSVFGDKPCHRGDYACLNQITPDAIVAQVKRLFLKK